VPCGISDRTCCQLIQFVPNLNVHQVRSVVAESFATVFDVKFAAIDLMDL
jgi:lipoate-protein ligase B